MYFDSNFLEICSWVADDLMMLEARALTHWGRVTHICVSKQTIIGSVNGLSPGRCQAIIWTNAGILLIGLLETNFSEILIEMRIFSFKKMGLNVVCEMATILSRPQCVNRKGIDLVDMEYSIASNGRVLWMKNRKINDSWMVLDKYCILISTLVGNKIVDHSLLINDFLSSLLIICHSKWPVIYSKI